MKSLYAPLALAVFAVLAILGAPIRGQQAQVRTVHSQGADPWTQDIVYVDDFEMRVVNANEGTWVVPVVTVSIQGDPETQAETIALYRKFYPELNPAVHDGQQVVNHFGPQFFSSSSTAGFSTPVPCDLALMTAAFARVEATTDSIRAHGQTILAGQDQLNWQSISYPTWEGSPSAIFWSSARPAGSSAPSETMNAQLLARAAMLEQFLVHTPSIATVDYVNSAIDALLKVELSLRMDITFMIITDGQGAQSGPTPSTTRSLPSLPSGPRPAIVLPNPVSVTFLPNPPVGNDGLRVIELPAPLPTVYPYFIGSTLEIALTPPTGETITALFQAGPEMAWQNVPVTVLPLDRVELTLPPEFPGGEVYFFTSVAEPVVPFSYAYGTGIFAMPFTVAPD